MTTATAPRSAQAVVQAYLHEVLSGAGPAGAADLVSSPGLRERVAAFHRSFGDLRLRTNVAVAADDLVAVHISARGTHRGMYRGIEPTGRPWTASCCAIYRVREGRVADFWMVWDVASILDQIGRPLPPERHGPD